MLLSLKQIEDKVDKLLERVEGASTMHTPTYGKTEDGARPHIEVDDFYHFVVVERGAEIARKSTKDLDELLYWIFDDITFSVASSYELHHRINGEDSRRLLFSKQSELLYSLSPDWARRNDERIRGILARYPSDEK